MNRWNTFWCRRVPPHALAFVRICLGLFLLLYAGLYLPHIILLFSSEGIAMPILLDSYPAFGLFLAPKSAAVTIMIAVVFYASIIGFTLGAYFRVCALCTLMIGLFAWQLQLHLFPASYNRLLFFCILVFAFSGAAKTWSFDVYRKRGSLTYFEPISILPWRLICIQMSATFIGVSLQKWFLPHWQGGEILAYSFMNRWATPLGFWMMQQPFSIEAFDILVYIVKLFQPIAAITLWIPKTRLVSIIFLGGFIILVAALMSIWWFVFLLPAFLLYYKPETVYTNLTK